MTRANEDLQTALGLFSDLLEQNEVEIDDFDYVEFLTETTPAIGDKIEQEAIAMVYRKFLKEDPNNTSRMRGWFEEMGVADVEFEDE